MRARLLGSHPNTGRWWISPSISDAAHRQIANYMHPERSDWFVIRTTKFSNVPGRNGMRCNWICFSSHHRDNVPEGNFHFQRPFLKNVSFWTDSSVSWCQYLQSWCFVLFFCIFFPDYWVIATNWWMIPLDLISYFWRRLWRGDNLIQGPLWILWHTSLGCIPAYRPVNAEIASSNFPHHLHTNLNTAKGKYATAVSSCSVSLYSAQRGRLQYNN